MKIKLRHCKKGLKFTKLLIEDAQMKFEATFLSYFRLDLFVAEIRFCMFSFSFVLACEFVDSEISCLTS